jgi:hypothetical protein
MSTSLASFGSDSSSLCLSASYLFPLQPFQFNLQANFTAIVIMQFLYSFHAILIVATPCHSSLFIFLLVCCSRSLSLLSVGKCSVDFVLANLFSDLSLTPFHALNALSHCRSHACIRPLSSFDTPHCTLRSCLGTPPAPTHLRFPVFDRECKYTAVSLPTRNRARCIAIGETRQGKVPVLSSTPARGTVFFLSLPFPSLGKRVEQGWQGHRASPWASQGGKGTRLNAIRHIRRLGA